MAQTTAFAGHQLLGPSHPTISLFSFLSLSASLFKRHRLPFISILSILDAIGSMCLLLLPLIILQKDVRSSFCLSSSSLTILPTVCLQTVCERLNTRERKRPRFAFAFGFSF